MKTFVIGDIHGGYRALLQCFERSGFDYQKDRLIALGDVCDGWPEVKQCIDELLKIKNLIFIFGNHDEWTLNWMKYGVTPSVWTEQGGQNTMASYGNNRNNVPQKHIKFLEDAHLYHVENNILFVHGGIIPSKPLNKTDKNVFLWDRDLLRMAYMTEHKSLVKNNKYAEPLTKYKEIFIGHTTTLMYQWTKPIHFCEVWDLDTGGGWEGKLTIMDLESHKYWQSEKVYKMYPESKGRR